MERSLLAALATMIDRHVTGLTVQAVGGGCIHQCWSLRDQGGQRWFVKSGPANRDAMLACEAYALRQLAVAPALTLPQVLAQGVAGQQTFLLLQWLELRAQGDWRGLGRGLAELHRHTAMEFGWAHDNFIGLTPQPNPRLADWARFWQQRLAYQLQLAHTAAPAVLRQLGERVLAAVPRLLNHQPPPSLLHGDLWSGNAAFLNDGSPVLFDPASHYGDRECEIALCELFGGFDGEFYAGYAASWPLDAAYAQRRPLYQLYHVLNHFNLFGAGYAAGAVQLMREVLG